MTETSQTFTDFREIVYKDFDKLDILKYYPYGNETTWEYWICGKVNLKEVYKEKRNELKTCESLVADIYDETMRAMLYLATESSNGFDSQRIEAFRLASLFNRGIIGWSKDALNGKSKKEIEKIERVHQKRYDLVANRIDQEKNKNTISVVLSKEAKLEYRRKYGLFEVKCMPLRQYGNCAQVPKILFTKQELCAIDLMVTCAFENLC